MKKIKCFFITILSLFILVSFHSIFSPPVEAQVLPQLPLPTIAANGILQSAGDTLNSVVPTVATLLNLGGDVSTVNKTVNNIITPPAQQAPAAVQSESNPPAQQGTSTTSTIQYPAASNTYYSTTPLQTTNPNAIAVPNSPGGAIANIPDRKDILLLNHANTESGKIILTKDINEVVFLADSLNPSRPPLTFIMPSERDVPILFNFEAFMTTDSIGQQHVTLPQGISMAQTAGKDSVSVSIPASEDISPSEVDCGADTWDGTLTALTILSPSSFMLQGKNVGVPIEIGRNDCGLDLSKEVTMFFMDRGSSRVGYRLQDQENLTEITSLCPITNQRECYTTEGKNLLVKTFHFTQFIVFTPVASVFSFLSNTALVAFILAIIITLLLAIVLGNWRVLRKVKTIAEVDEQKSEYVSTVSHELRTPLTAIKGFISMILGGDYGPVKKNMKKPLHEVEVSAQRSIDMVNEVLDVSRIESGKVKLTLSEFPIDFLITEAIDFLMPIAIEKKLSLAAQNLDKTTIQADQEKARQLIINLIANALKYTEHGSITLSTKENPKTVTIFITDTGVGIPQDQKERLFKKFERINTQAEGTGLGLYISKKLAQKMGGDVYLQKSEQGVGSTFGLVLLKADSELAKRLLKKTKAH